MSYLSPAPNQAPDSSASSRARPGLAGSLREWLKALGPYAAIAMAVLYLRHGAPAVPPPPPDRIQIALEHWHQGQVSAYHLVAEKLRTGQITRLDQVSPALKEAFLPTAKEVTDSLSAALQVLTDSQGNFTNQPASADVLERASKASGGTKP
jgi:hypothetical protein